jgi:hypothetical protein
MASTATRMNNKAATIPRELIFRFMDNTSAGEETTTVDAYDENST